MTKFERLLLINYGVVAIIWLAVHLFLRWERSKW